MIESIKTNGLMNLIVVRRKGKRYELISGHRRKEVMELLGNEYISAIIKELYEAYYNSLVLLKDNNLHSISFPLISSGIFGYGLDNSAMESAKQCVRAYNKFIDDYKDYDVEVKLCAFTLNEYNDAREVTN